MGGPHGPLLGKVGGPMGPESSYGAPWAHICFHIGFRDFRDFRNFSFSLKDSEVVQIVQQNPSTSWLRELHISK